MTHGSGSQEFWQRRSNLLAWQINLAAWVARAAPAAFFVACPFAIVFYALRRLRAPVDGAAIGFLAAVLIVGFVCWCRARRGFFAAQDARVLLESHLKLDSRLTAASANLVPWPETPAKVPPVVRWRLAAPLGWVGGALVLLTLATSAPVPPPPGSSIPSGPPPALAETEAMLEALKELNVAEPQAIEQLADRAQQLADRPADQQYSHSALEAADALRNQTISAAAALARDLDAAANAMKAAENSIDMDGAAGRLAAALSGLRDGTLPANKELLSQLPASAADLKNLTPEQRAELARRLAAASQCTGGVAGGAGAGVRVAEPNPKARFSWLNEGMGGGPGGGGSHAPLALSSLRSDVGEGRAEGLTAESLENFALGDRLGTSAGSHEVDTGKLLGPMSAGAISAPAGGGEAAWVNRLTPAERTALKEFFK